jgi:nitrite transporter NirC
MPIPVAEAVAEQAELARTKAVAAKNVPKYLFGSALAGAYVGVGIVLLAATTGPLAAANSPAVKLVAGAVFGVALTLVIMAGSELFTGLNMIMLQGLAAGTVNVIEVLFVWMSSLVGNLVGSLAFAYLINAGGTLSAKTPAGKLGPGQAFLESLVKAKNAAPGAQLFWRALACNMLVCLAVWMAARTRNDAAKVMVIWWCLMAFIAVGLEHSVAARFEQALYPIDVIAVAHHN